VVISSLATVLPVASFVERRTAEDTPEVGGVAADPQGRKSGFRHIFAQRPALSQIAGK